MNVLSAIASMKNRNRCLIFGLAACALLFAASLPTGAQQEASPALRPPKGARVAIVVFEDLQCPDCRRAQPLVEEASRTYKIPLVIHDFPLPFHSWSYDA